MKDVYKKYKKYIENSRKQTKFLKENFTQNKMTEVLKNYMNNINITTNVPLQLPKLQLPKLNKTSSNPPQQIKLPKLKKIKA